MSPEGGSTLMTSAPKSDRITAALGPAMKLARSTTLSPEKMLSVMSASMKLRFAFLEKRGSAFALICTGGADTEVSGLESTAFALARIEPFRDRFEGELYGNRSVGRD